MTKRRDRSSTGPHRAGPSGWPRRPRTLLLILLLALAACGPTVAPTVPPTAAPATSAPTPMPPPTATPPPPTSTALPTAPPTDPPIKAGETWSLFFFELALRYDPATWEVQTQGQVDFLAHRQIANCTIQEQGPTEPPAIVDTVALNGIEYERSEVFEVQEGVVERWYLARGGFDNPDPATIPVFRVRAPADDPQACFDAGEEVVGTLYNPGTTQ